ncbi:DUF3515 domain-containing protein [Nocardia iowensis]|uniref:DUF3515 domain-containing protein n=1 Tax=Nocardia iowensis TaxID=204891 RepID=A0ABX8RQP8_NOCIO|nr:DUF3515 domain-containing protein [Nocardia iowensis]QXN89776.1 DUF3515 domain-containing protein [Nocardia iowensis]
MAAESSDRDSAKDKAGQPAADAPAADTRPDADAPPNAGGAEAAATSDAADGDAGPAATRSEVAAPDTVDGRAETASESATSDAETVAHAAGGSTQDGAAQAASTRQYSPALIATAVALPVVLVVAVLVAAILARRAPVEREPLVLGPVPAPAATGPACTTLLPALPTELGEFTKSTLVEPSPPATRAWQRPDGGDPIVLRCGLDRPLEFNRASALQIVNGVQWFEARDQAAKASTWFAVDRETYIALTVPDGSGPTPLQAVSDTITANLPATPLDPSPLPN